MKPILAFILIGCSIFVKGQESKKYLKNLEKDNWIEGYVVLKDSSVIEGIMQTFKSNEYRKYKEVIFIKKDGEKKWFYPIDLFEYGYSSNTFISNSSSLFELVKKGDKVSLYRIKFKDTWSAPGAPGMGSQTYSTSQQANYFKKAGAYEFIPARKKKFNEVFSEYFNDCVFLTQKIQSKEITYEDVNLIFNEYNFKCE